MRISDWSSDVCSSDLLPFPDWRRPVGEDEEFLARSWSEGRHDWKQFEVRRREIVVAARPGTNPAFDRRFLERLEAGTLSSLASELSQPELEAAAGKIGRASGRERVCQYV